MTIKRIYRAILRRPSFKGQSRLFNYLFKRNKLANGLMTVKPLLGNFLINCDTKTWIGAKIVYTGDYETPLKEVFKSIIKKGDRVLDIGANIGFHTLFFADLVGHEGLVYAFEPVEYNYQSLKYNVGLNQFQNVRLRNIALGNKNEDLNIVADEHSNNPGSFNLFSKDGNVTVKCHVGDEIVREQRIDFIKIDVEGYEAFVLDGLIKSIKQNRPKIIFEYDLNYHQKTGLPPDYIFDFFEQLNYKLFEIKQTGLQELTDFAKLSSENILAIPHE